MKRVLAAACSLMPLVVFGADIQVAGEAGVAYSDNIRRASTNEESDTTLIAATEFSIREDRRRLQANIVGSLAYQEYLQNTYDGDVMGAVDASAAFGLIPERLTWLAQDNFGQTLQDPFASDTPDNREYVNYFTTGPDFIVRLGSADQVRVGGRYSIVTYERSPFDNKRGGGVLAYTHELSSATSVSLIGQHESVNFDADSTGTDFSRDALFARYTLRGARTTLEVDAGTNRVKLDNGGPAENGGMARIQGTRQLGRFSTLSVLVSRELTESGNTLRFQQDAANLSLDTTSLPASPDPFRLDTVSVGIDSAGRRTRIGASVSEYRERFERLNGPDRDRFNAELHVARDLGPQLSARLGLSYRKEELVHLPDELKETVVTAGLDWHVTGHLYIGALVERSNRSANLPGREYDETRGLIRARIGAPMVRGVGPFGPR